MTETTKIRQNSINNVPTVVVCHVHQDVRAGTEAQTTYTRAGESQLAHTHMTHANILPSTQWQFFHIACEDHRTL